MNFIDFLKSNKAEFLSLGSVKNPETWSKIQVFRNIPHNKEGLDLFLGLNIVEIISNNRSYFCTSNSELINKILESQGNRSRFANNFFHKKSGSVVLTWNLESNSLVSISMKSDWVIKSFLPIVPANASIINRAIGSLHNR